MLDWFKTLPHELPILLGVSFILVVIPATLTIFIRISLHNHLQELNKKIERLLKEGIYGEKSPIVEKLENRFRDASSQLEHVNTGALIDEIYSHERFSFLGFQLQCEQWEYFSRLLPNLLLAFGLVGTFSAITYNLYNMSRTLSQTNLNASEIGAHIQPYLQGMGLAFVTSLIALLCSSILTIVNMTYNTSVAKHKFLSSLEDYLDNIYKPNVEGDTRLDKAVNRMVEQQEQFLIRFHKEVGKVLEDTFGKAANKIVEGNKKSQDLATQVYQSFSEAAGTISSSASTFRDASLTMVKQTESFKETTGKMQKSLESIVAFSNNIREAAESLERSNFLENLENTTTNLRQTTTDLAQTQKTLSTHLIQTQETFSNSVTFLGNCIEQVAGNHRQSIEVSQQVHNQLYTYSKHLQQGSQVFLQASQALQQGQFIEQISSLNQNVREIIIPLGEKIQEAQSNIDLLCEVMIQNIDSIKKVDENLTKNQETIYDVGQEITGIVRETQQSNVNQLQVINGSLNSLNSQIYTLNEVGEKITGVLGETQKSNVNQLQGINKKFDSLNTQIDTLNEVGEKITEVLGETQKSNVNQLQVINRKFDSLTTQIDSLNGVGQEITGVLGNNQQNNVNQLQVINKKFETLNKIVNNLLLLAQNNYSST